MSDLVVAVLGDTHLPRGTRRLPPRALELCAQADLVVHTGDWVTLAVAEELEALGPPLHGVQGNNDDAAVRARFPEELRLDVGQVRLGCVHDAGPAAGRVARLQRRFPDCDVVLFGHSHIPLTASGALGDFHVLNPGSATDRRRQPRHTMALVRVSGQDVDFELVALD